jgi:2-C-methyl-D-erythritol 4-phosphate cytidylyltransferase
MSTAVIIVAAGRGHRMGGETPKQYLPLDAHSALHHSARVFLDRPQVSQLCTVIHPDDAGLYADAMTGLKDPRLMAPVPGGDTRAASVLAGLKALKLQAPDHVLIHDAARPFVTAEIIDSVCEGLQEVEGCCAALPVIDALWSSDGKMAQSSIPRDGLWRAQTPQGFHFEALYAAHLAHDGSGADDVAVAREAGMQVRFVQGSDENYKITTPQDLARARAALT